MSRMYGPEEKAKLERLINEGSTVLREIEDLQEGLKETVKAVAEELDVKPSIINKAIKIAHKDNWKVHEEEWDEIETILSIACSIIMAVTVPNPPLFVLYPMWILACAVYTWAAWTRKSFGMLANYVLLTSIDTYGLIRLLNN